jgi:ASPIC and UnbV
VTHLQKASCGFAEAHGLFDRNKIESRRHRRVAEVSSEGLAQVEQAKGGMGYMSASDPRIHFGLGKRTKVETLEIIWPSGQLDRLTNVPSDQIIAVKEGVGIVARRFPKFVGPK